MISSIKDSRTFLYMIFVVIFIMIIIYYMLGDKSIPIIKVPIDIPFSPSGNIVKQFFEEVNLDSVKNLVKGSNFSNIVITS